MKTTFMGAAAFAAPAEAVNKIANAGSQIRKTGVIMPAMMTETGVMGKWRGSGGNRVPIRPCFIADQTLSLLR